MPFLVMLLIVPLYYGRVFYHYTISHNAAQSAARYLSRIPVAEITNPERAPLAASVANQMITMMLAEITPGPYPPNIQVSCGTSSCAGLIKPLTVSVTIQILVVDFFFPTNLSIPFEVVVQMPYLGR